MSNRVYGARVALAAVLSIAACTFIPAVTFGAECPPKDAGAGAQTQAAGSTPQRAEAQMQVSGSNASRPEAQTQVAGSAVDQQHPEASMQVSGSEDCK